MLITASRISWRDTCAASVQLSPRSGGQTSGFRAGMGTSHGSGAESPRVWGDGGHVIGGSCRTRRLMHSSKQRDGPRDIRGHPYVRNTSLLAVCTHMVLARGCGAHKDVIEGNDFLRKISIAEDSNYALTESRTYVASSIISTKPKVCNDEAFQNDAA